MKSNRKGHPVKKVCLVDLEEKLMREEIIYGKAAVEDGGTAIASEESEE